MKLTFQFVPSVIRSKHQADTIRYTAIIDEIRSDLLNEVYRKAIEEADNPDPAEYTMCILLSEYDGDIITHYIDSKEEIIDFTNHVGISSKYDYTELSDEIIKLSFHQDQLDHTKPHKSQHKV